MAEFALGLTKAAVEGTLSRVKSAIEEEGKQRERVQEDLVFITGEFQMMQAFLNASSAGERASKNLVARAWVRQLRDLAFDVEDCVEFVVNLDKPSRWDWVQRLASSLPCLDRPPLPLDVAVAEIKRLKARVEDVSQRNTRYNLIAGGGDNDGDNQHQQQHQLLMRPVGYTTSAAATTFHDLMEVWKVMGKLCHIIGGLEGLINCQCSELKVISLWRSPQADIVGELGWVDIVKKVYDGPEICREFKNCAWVKLTHPFNPVEFLNNLLTQFRTHQHYDEHRHESISELVLQVKRHKYLIVIEQELRNVSDWDAIKMYLPDGNNGSRIIISTKHLRIALVCTGDPYQVSELQHFSHGRYLCALSPKGCEHRIGGIGEFIWQLRRQGGVTSLYWRTSDHINYLFDELVYARGTKEFRIFDGVKFEHHYNYGFHEPNIELAKFAMCILEKQENIYEEEFVEKMSDQERIETCRKFLTEHDCLIFIHVFYLAEWDLIRKDLLCDSTRGCIVVITADLSVAKHCVDHQQCWVLNVEDLMEKSGYAGEEGYIKDVGKLDGLDLDSRIERDEKIYISNLDRPVTISVWGIAGVGKSAFVRKAYTRRYEVSQLPDYRMYSWVDVPDPFDLMELCRNMLLDFYLDDFDAKESVLIGMMEGLDPIQVCCKILHQNKCLLVIDGIRSTHDWDLIKVTLISQPISGTTIVITREESIARHCTRFKDNIINLKGLRADLALLLFKKVTLGNEQLSEMSSEEENILKVVISKCGGLPEVIVAICKIGTSYENFIRYLGYLYSDFMGILEIRSTIHSLRGVFSWMQSYFDACPDELKPCIFYLSIFPLGQSIRRRRLLRRWIAEGYSSGGAGPMEEKGEKLLSELMKLSILYEEQQPSSTIRSCMINGFFREYIKSQPMEDNLVFALEGSCGPNPRLTGKHLTVSSNWDRDKIVFNSIEFSRLRSLTVFGKWMPFLISDKMKVLRVLDLEGTSTTSDGTASVTDDVLEKIGKQFPRLKFLSLRGCVEVTRLPDSLGAMSQLETLDVRHTSIVELPPAVITRLHKLQYIRAGTNEARRLRAAAAEAMPIPSQTSTLSPPLTTTTTQEGVHGGVSPLLGAKEGALCVVQRASSTRITVQWKRRAHALVESSSSNSWWESKKQRRRRARVAANGGGVEVIRAAAEGIRKLTELHTLGVVNIAGGGGGLLLLKELKNLTQLRKLGLSGINRENWRDLCSAISGQLPHLESLSLQLMLLEKDGDYDFARLDDISVPPKTLKSIKVLYTTTGGHVREGASAGGACRWPTWTEQLPKLKKFRS